MIERAIRGEFLSGENSASTTKSYLDSRTKGDTSIVPQICSCFSEEEKWAYSLEVKISTTNNK
jgi:hypothetical protein